MEPITLDEIFMAAAAGEYSGTLPEPVTRFQYYMKKIAEGSSTKPEDIDAAIEAYLNSHDADIVTEAELTQALAGKAAASHSHAQSDITGLDTALSGKAAVSHTHAQSDVTGLDSALAGKAAVSHAHDDRYYTETEIDNKLGGKSNTGHTHDDRYYTEDETDTLLSGKADSSDIPDVSSFITKAVNDLTNYYTKSETYTQTEIDNMVSAIPKFAIEVVQALPSQNISPTTVYLLTVQSGQQGNMYDEYIHVGNSWELLGTQTVDLSGYYTSAQVDALLSGLPVAGHTHDDRYYTETEIDGKIQTINMALSGKAASDHNHDDRYYTETEIDNKLGEKSNTGHSHVVADVTGLDSALAGKAAVSHTHAQSDITGLSDALTGKADANHNHSGVYAPASHTHTKSQITDLANATASAAGLMSAADKEKLDNNNAGYKVKIWEGSQNLVANSDLSTGCALTNFSALEIRYAMFSNHSANYIKTIRITRKDTDLAFGEVIPAEKYEYSSGTLSLSICGLTISGSHIYLTYPEGASSFWVFGVYGYK